MSRSRCMLGRRCTKDPLRTFLRWENAKKVFLGLSHDPRKGREAVAVKRWTNICAYLLALRNREKNGSDMCKVAQHSPRNHDNVNGISRPSPRSAMGGRSRNGQQLNNNWAINSVNNQYLLKLSIDFYLNTTKTRSGRVSIYVVKHIAIVITVWICIVIIQTHRRHTDAHT